MPGPGRCARSDGVHAQLLAEFGGEREVGIGRGCWGWHAHLLEVQRGWSERASSTRLVPVNTVAASGFGSA